MGEERRGASEWERRGERTSETEAAGREGGRGRRREGASERANGVNGGRGNEWEMIHAVSEPPSVPACPSAAPGAAAPLPAAPGLSCPPSLTGSCARRRRGGDRRPCGAAPRPPRHRRLRRAHRRLWAGGRHPRPRRRSPRAGEVRAEGGGASAGGGMGRVAGGGQAGDWGEKRVIILSSLSFFF